MSRRLIFAGLIILALGCVAAVLVLSLPHHAPTSSMSDDKLAGILARGKLVIATDAAYPPNSELIPGASRTPGTICARDEYTAGQLTGYNVAVAKGIAQRLGVEPCFVTPSRTEIISGTWADRWDIHVGSMAITRERMKILSFTRPYYAGPVVLFVHRNNTAYSTASELSGRRIGVCAGCILERYLDGTLDLPGQTIDFAIRNATIVAYENEAVALADLGAGDGKTLDAVLTNGPLGDEAIRGGTPIKSLGSPLFYDYDAAAVDRKSGRDPSSFIRNVSAIIRQMEQDGTLLALSQQYYGKDLVSSISRFDAGALERVSAD